MNHQELQHLVHCSHIEDDPQLGHSHRNQTPQKDGGEHRAAERNGIWEQGGDFIHFIGRLEKFWTGRFDIFTKLGKWIKCKNYKENLMMKRD